MLYFSPSLTSVLKEELVSTDSELQAVEIQIQELLERQQELIHKKTVLKNKIKQFSEDSEAGESEETETSAEAWNKQGLQNEIQLLSSLPFNVKNVPRLINVDEIMKVRIWYFGPSVFHGVAF